MNETDRLIDADKLLKDLHITDNDNDNRAQCIDLYELKKVIDGQPTGSDRVMDTYTERKEK